MKKIYFWLSVSILGIFIFLIIKKKQKVNPLPYVLSGEVPTQRKKEFIPSLYIPPALELAKIPLAKRFRYPAGSQTGAFTYQAQDFLEKNPDKNTLHLGIDINGIGGDNTDLGDPVYAIADGLVQLAAKQKGGWGKVIIIAHRLPNKNMIQSLYAHLQKIKVSVGEIVHFEQEIGTIGTANGQYLAHLHFELRSGFIPDTGKGYANKVLNSFDFKDLKKIKGIKVIDKNDDFLIPSFFKIERQLNETMIFNILVN